MSRALIVNAYAIGNRGDAAIVQGLMALLREAGATHVAVAARGWSSEYRGWLDLGADEVVPPLLSVHEVPRWAKLARPLLLLHVLWRLTVAVVGHFVGWAPSAAQAYANAQLVVSAGGSYLGGGKIGINFVKLATIWYGRVLGRPVVVAPMTINPPSPMVGRLIRSALRGNAVFVRDAPSREVLARIGLPSQVAPDLALVAPSVRSAIEVGARDEVGGHVCWSPRSYRPDHDAWLHRESIEARAVEAVADVVRTTGRPLRFIPQVSASESDDDRVAIERIVAELPADVRQQVEILPPADRLEDTLAQFASCDLLLAGRLHASILAMASGVPSLVVAYEPKVDGVLGELGLSDRSVRPDLSWSSQDLADRMRRLLEPDERRRTRRAISRIDRGLDEFREALRSALGDGQ